MLEARNQHPEAPNLYQNNSLRAVYFYSSACIPINKLNSCRKNSGNVCYHSVQNIWEKNKNWECL